MAPRRAEIGVLLSSSKGLFYYLPWRTQIVEPLPHSVQVPPSIRHEWVVRTTSSSGVYDLFPLEDRRREPLPIRRSKNGRGIEVLLTDCWCESLDGHVFTTEDVVWPVRDIQGFLEPPNSSRLFTAWALVHFEMGTQHIVLDITEIVKTRKARSSSRTPSRSDAAYPLSPTGSPYASALSEYNVHISPTSNGRVVRKVSDDYRRSAERPESRRSDDYYSEYKTDYRDSHQREEYDRDMYGRKQYEDRTFDENSDRFSQVYVSGNYVSRDNYDRDRDRPQNAYSPSLESGYFSLSNASSGTASRYTEHTTKYAPSEQYDRTAASDLSRYAPKVEPPDFYQSSTHQHDRQSLQRNDDNYDDDVPLRFKHLANQQQQEPSAKYAPQGQYYGETTTDFARYEPKIEPEEPITANYTPQEQYYGPATTNVARYAPKVEPMDTHHSEYPVAMPRSIGRPVAPPPSTLPTAYAPAPAPPSLNTSTTSAPPPDDRVLALRRTGSPVLVQPETSSIYERKLRELFARSDIRKVLIDTDPKLYAEICDKVAVDK